MRGEAFQDRIPDNRCFGCGPENPAGLRIKSTWEGPRSSVCTYRPEAYHSAGPAQYLNGGIIATLIDCHSVCTAVAWLYRAEGREVGSEPTIWCVTGELSVRYLLPTPIAGEVTLRAIVLEAGAKKVRLECTLSAGDEERAVGEVLAIRVPSGWLHGTGSEPDGGRP